MEPLWPALVMLALELLVVAILVPQERRFLSQLTSAERTAQIVINLFLILIPAALLFMAFIRLHERSPQTLSLMVGAFLVWLVVLAANLIYRLNFMARLFSQEREELEELRKRLLADLDRERGGSTGQGEERTGRDG